MTIHLRADRAMFRFSGDEAPKLVNDVVTGHIPSGPDDNAAWWALLSPQGKILAEGLAGWADDALWLDVHVSVADDFLKRMKMYRLRAKVAIDDLRETHRVGYSSTAMSDVICHADRRGSVALGYRIIAPIAAETGWDQDAAPYTAARIAAGILAQGADFPANDAFAHDLGMDLLDGIDFVKGCYVGQEVVSRMKHRGTARRRPVIVSGIEAPTGAALIAGTREAGTIGQVQDGRAVAILRLDRITDTAGVTVAERPVTVTLPAWATYAFGESSESE